MPLVDKHHYLTSELIQFTCPSSGTLELPNFSDKQWQEVTIRESAVYIPDETTDANDTEQGSDDSDEDAGEDDAKKSTTKVPVGNVTSLSNQVKKKPILVGKVEPSKVRREAPIKTKPTGNATSVPVAAVTKPTAVLEKIPGAVLQVPSEGMYMFIIRGIYDGTKGNITVTVSTFGTYGYLSVIDWPLLPFYAVLCTVYALSLIAWFILCCCFRKDLLQIQYWIGAVLFIGFVEEAAFLGEYHTVNKDGQSVPGAVIFGELVSALKRSLARMLVIVVSVGFGIVKPRLGPTLPKVLAVGIVCFIANSFDGFRRATTHKANQQSTGFMVLLIALAVVDAAICWWVFTALVNTMRTLRIRRNVHKLSLYRHFTNTLIFSVLASLAFMIWSIVEHKRVACLTDWRELWVDDAFWHLLFSVILVVIMILFRPSANNQRYVYSPVADGEDDDAVEPMINESFEGMKMRGSKGSRDGLANSRQSDKQTEDDLKWIEENIPASVADSTLPSLLDSEEEIMTTKYEMSKMQ
jgi:hypothetical protein